VALVLVLNRLLFPLPLYQVADWVVRSWRCQRPNSTMTAWAGPWMRCILTCRASGGRWSKQLCSDLSVIFYDLTAFVAQGRYPDSEVIDFGFAHNTPKNKRKFKTGFLCRFPTHLGRLKIKCFPDKLDISLFLTYHSKHRQHPLQRLALPLPLFSPSLGGFGQMDHS
jgi:hypothetical protein